MDRPVPMSRRAVLRLAGLGVGAAAVTTLPLPAAAGASPAASASGGRLPVAQIEKILQADGSVTNGVLGVGIDRTDIGPVTLRGVPIEPSFEINGDLTFQPHRGRPGVLQR